MKKSILLLLVLLITLIGTCIYKKAYLPSMKEKSRESSPKDKRHIVVKTHTLYPIDHSIEVKAVAKVEPKPVVAKESIEKKELPQVKEPIKEKEIVAPKKIYPTIQPMPIVAPTEVAKVEPKPMIQTKVQSQTEQEIKEVTTPIKQQQEQMNLLLDALQDRDNAMQSRQAFIEKIEDFINTSLEKRLNVIRTMGKYQINMDKLQEKIIETRDTIYIQISKPNTSTLGE